MKKIDTGLLNEAPLKCPCARNVFVNSKKLYNLSDACNCEGTRGRPPKDKLEVIQKYFNLC